MSFKDSFKSLFGVRGPYGEDRFSMVRKDRTFRSQPLDEDRLQGDANRQFLRQTCMDLYRVSGLARAAVNRISDYAAVCTAYPATSDAKWNEQAAAFYSSWKDIADYRQRPGVDMSDIVQMIHIADHLIGESFFVLLDNGQIQPVEADRIATPNEWKQDRLVQDGIRTNASGIITHYYVCDRDKNGAVDLQKYRRIAASNMVQIVDPWRIDQLHGVPRIHAAVRKLQDYDETDEAMRAKIKNEAQRFFQTEGSLPAGGPRMRTLGDAGGKYKIFKTDIGQVWDGGKLELMESKSPNATYTPHMIEEAKAVAASCDIPYEYLMMIFTAGSYNAQKGARLAFADTCIRRARHVNKWFLQRTYNWRIAKAIKDGDLPPAPYTTRNDGLRISEWYKVEWGLPRFQDIDLAGDVSAKSAAWAAGQQSLRNQSENPYQVLQDKAEDIIKADEIADKINSQLKTGQVTWQNIINAGVPGLTVQPLNKDEKPDEDKDDEQTK